MRLIYLLVTILTLHSSYCLIDIRTEGAVSHVDSLAAQFQNSAVIRASILKANSS